MPGKSKQGGGLEVGSSYKMKNSALHMGAKHGSPIQGNYGSPNKDYSVNKGSHNHPHAPTKYTGHYNDPRMAQGSGAENEVLHGSGQATVQAPIAMKGSASPAKKDLSVTKTGDKRVYKYGDKVVSEEEYTKIRNSAIEEGKKNNPDFNPRSTKEMTS
tara:strand:+ start:2183 stop:2656 length:474 start_codon:yes stop_codon:yes gene_type:complete